jgi:TM2 domain-containing membrane protein YozV
MKTLAENIFFFYVDGFRRMRLGRTLWAIILIKLLIMFGVLKLFFFHDYLHEKYHNNMERADHVFSQLTATHTE